MLSLLYYYSYSKKDAPFREQHKINLIGNLALVVRASGATVACVLDFFHIVQFGYTANHVVSFFGGTADWNFITMHVIKPD